MDKQFENADIAIKSVNQGAIKSPVEASVYLDGKLLDRVTRLQIDIDATKPLPQVTIHKLTYSGLDIDPMKADVTVVEEAYE